MNETWPEIKKRKLKERRGETFDWIQSLVVALFACVLIFTFLVRVVGVVGTSMLNTLHPGDRILVSNLFYTPKRGDIIVLRKESFNSEPIVKRVIATEGETVTIDFEGGIVYVDGVALDEPYTLEPTHRRIDFGDSVTVPEGCLFVMGDNRNGSTDSRDDRIGCVDERLVIGRAFFLLVPGGDSQHGESRDWSRPDVERIVGSKPRLIVLNRADQADAAATALWKKALTGEGALALEMDCKSGRGVNAFPAAARSLLKEKIERAEAKGQVGKALRFMVLGVPNVGKSSFINRLAGRKAAETSDRPGVTRGKQWITLNGGILLLDTPGILWPKFESPEVGYSLAWTGAINDNILDVELVACRLLERLRELYPDAIEARYKFTPDPEAPGYELLEAAARKRGFLISGGEVNTERMAHVLLDEFREGKLGRMTLERP